MRFLLDQGLPRSTADHLRSRGFEAEHIGSLGQPRATDHTIMEMARARSAVVVTLDADFHRILAQSGEASPSVIRIREQGLRTEPLAALVCQVYAHAAEDLDDGAVVSARQNRVRVHHLPLGGAEHQSGR